MAEAAEKIDSSPKEAVRNVFLQLASFRRQSNATRLRDRLIEMSVESVQIKDFRHRGQIYYRVRVGPLPSKGTAMEVADSLDSLGLGAPLIVSE
ncbi:SPOR domain-containing protein [Thioalkalivibrio sp. HK1]|uniref:SPOR domain-containing protein n=1 Tax=Thioalkalivibrio sp. HK1 TaxID=1469245 RepID=UPI001E60343F|nr:SPOR domain-containing protein [Thioalkalivibrio sp. HK1]